MNKQLERLLEAHLAHELASWQDAALERTVVGHVHSVFTWLGTVTIDEIVTTQQILGVIERYVIELRLSGGITELNGEMSRLVFHSRVTQDTRVDDILAPESYEDMAEKLVALEGARRELIALVAQSSTFASINARMLVRGFLHLVTPHMPLAPKSVAQPLAALVERLGAAVAPQFEQRMADLLGSYLAQHRALVTAVIEEHLLSVLHPERLRALLDELWDAVAPMRLSEVFAVMGDQDIEDFVVLIYEFWQRYRKTEFFRRISSEMVDYFFDKYGGEAVSSVIEDMGVTERMVSTELIGFLRPILAHAAHSGALAVLLRTRLREFYESPAALAALSG